MIFELHTFLLLGGVALVAGIITGIAGSGGTIVLPSLLIAGVPPHIALGANKFFTTAALFTSTSCFLKKGIFTPRLWLGAIVATFLGAILGAGLAIALSSAILETVLPVMIILAVIFCILPKPKATEIRGKDSKPPTILSILMGWILGIYSGFIGVASAPMWTNLSMLFFKVDIVKANALSHFMCLISNFAALVVFIWFAEVNYTLGIMLAVFGTLGAFVGAKMALHFGGKLIKPLITSIALLMAGNLTLTAWV